MSPSVFFHIHVRSSYIEDNVSITNLEFAGENGLVPEENEFCDMRNNRGSDRELISSRNQRLSARFYWYSNIIGLKYAKCLFYLEKEKGE